MKKILSLLFCLILGCSLVACGQTTASPAGTDSEEVTSAGSDSNGNEEKPTGWNGCNFDPETEHKFLATDIKNHSIVIFDLNRCRGNLDNLVNRTCVVWEWDADKDLNCKLKPGAGLDAAKLRYSPYYGKDVIVACSSSGWAGVIDYEKKTVLWEYQIGGGPHSIELMPDSGDIVVAGSSGEGVLAFTAITNETKVYQDWDTNYVFACVPYGNGKRKVFRFKAPNDAYYKLRIFQTDYQ